MKSFLLALALISGFNIQASTIDGYTLPITGEKTEQNFTMNSVQTRTEYRNETITKTCYRTVADGYHTICRQEPENYCYEDSQSRRICGVRYVNRCRNEIRYRTEAYTCYETVSIPYEVFSHNVRANVNVVVASTPGTITAPHNTCLIDFTLNGDNFKSLANCPEFIILAKSSASESRQGATVVQDRSLELTLLDSQAVSAPTKNGISEMRLEGQTLVFRAGDLTKNSNFSLKLNIERRNLLKKDETLINRNLAPTEYTFLKSSEESGLVKIDLSKLIGGINTKKKHVLKVDLNVLLNTSAVLNRNLPNLSASESITVNN